MHSEATIILLEEATTQLGDQFRTFVEAVDNVKTVETASESRKREKSQKTKAAPKPPAKTGTKASGNGKGPVTPAHIIADAGTSGVPSSLSTDTDDNPCKGTSVQPRLLIRIPPRAHKGAEPHTIQQPSGPLAISRSPDAAPQNLAPAIAQPTITQATSSTEPSVANALPLEAAPVAAASNPRRPPDAADSATKKKTAQTSTRRSRKLNIGTVKFHALGHYPATIRLFGTSDLYSTEWVSLSA